MASLSDTDKARVRYHLEYPDMSQGPAIAFGITFDIQVVSVLENAMNNLNPTAIETIQRLLTILDGIEAQMVDAQARMKASKADVVVLNKNEMLDLENAYHRWQTKLTNVVSIPVNPNRIQGAGGTLNMRLARG